MLFIVNEGKGNHKYTAVLDSGKKVKFGDKRYEHFKDKIGFFSDLDHNDKKRRKNYRARHGAIKLKDGTLAVNKKYSPAWFSYNYLW